MAAKGKKPSPAVDIPECPVCLDTMTAPIFLCASGHSLCGLCTQALCPPTCPICRQPMTQMRNHSLEDIISKARMACPNRGAGCVYQLPAAALPGHVEECIFRARDCPHAVFGKCSWTGEVMKLFEHFKEKHAANCLPGLDSDVEISNLQLKECGRYVYLAMNQNLLYIVTFRVDSVKGLAYWAVQFIGQKKLARQHIYEIHVISKQDPQRKVVFTEHCFNDTMKTDEIFQKSNCAVVPLEMLAHFIKDKKLSFRFVIKKFNNFPNKENNEVKNENKSRAPRSHSRVRDSSQGPEARGPGPKPHWKKHPGQKAVPKKFTPSQS